MNRTLKIYHDSFLQYGGAEKIPLVWAKHFKIPVICTGLNPKLFPAQSGVIQAIFKTLKRPESLMLLYPFLFLILKLFKKRYFRRENVVLVSSSGVGHYFPVSAEKSVLYMNTPTRWIWKKNDFEIGVFFPLKIICNLARPLFKNIDRKLVNKYDTILSNSINTKKQIKEIYGRESDVVYPPVSIPDIQAEPIEDIDSFDRFVLIVARNKGYKFLNYLEQLSNQTKMRIVICGSKTESLSKNNVIGLGLVSEANLAWLYQNANYLLGIGEEDFGLTPVEAALHGCPTIAFRRGGYKETIIEGVNGFFVDSGNIKGIIELIESSRVSELNTDQIIHSASRFDEVAHLSKIQNALKN